MSNTEPTQQNKEPMVTVEYRPDALVSHYVKCKGCGWQQGYSSGSLARAVAEAHKAAPHGE